MIIKRENVFFNTVIDEVTSISMNLFNPTESKLQRVVIVELEEDGSNIDYLKETAIGLFDKCGYKSLIADDNGMSWAMSGDDDESEAGKVWITSTCSHNALIRMNEEMAELLHDAKLHDVKV